MKKILLISLMLINGIICFGQTYDFSTITVNGLEILKTYSNSQIFSALGNPATTLGPAIGDPYPHYYSYIYTQNNKDNIFAFNSDVFNDFILRNSQFSLNSFIKVGDNISKLSQMSGSVTAKGNNIKYWKPNSTNPAYYDLSVMFKFSPTTNIISEVSLIMPL